MTSRHYKFSAE